jgi:imidazolonepropionase-like amidohydrolase
MRRILKVLKWTGLGLVAFLLIIISILAISIPLARSGETNMTDPGETFAKLVINNVNVVPMDSNYVLYNHSVFIENGVITKVEPDSMANYFGYEQVDAEGGYMMPGLIDMHAHLFDRTDAAQFLSYGVTTARNMMGFPMHLRWKAQQKKGSLIGSKIITATPTLNSGSDTGPFHKNLESTEDIPLLLKRYKEEGYDFVKIYDGISREQFESIKDEADVRSLAFAGHPPRAVDLVTLAKSGISSVEHIEEIFQGLLNYKFDKDSAHVIAKVLAENQIAVCVNLAAYHQIFMAVTRKQDFLDTQYSNKINPLLMFIGKKQLSEYPGYSQEGYDWTVKKYHFMERLVKIFNETGVPLIFGTDTGPVLTVPGETVLWEIDLLQKAGLSDYQILASATKNAARVLKNNKLGLIKSGAVSDLIIMKENPLDNALNIQNIESVVQGSRFYGQNELKILREIGENKQSAYTTLGNFLDHIFSK